jgi:RNA polymerase sigma-70 factor (ECF subfamily)
VAEPSTFRDLMRRVRAGDGDAAAELVRVYEPAIRRAVRVRLVDSRLERLFDSMDICQSVLASFFVRAAAGQYELDRPDQLQRLLAGMARHKLIHQIRRQQADRRDFRRRDAAGPDEMAGDDTTPSEVVAGRDLLRAVRERLTPEERHAELGGTPEALRKRLTRALDRVTGELGLED